MYLFMILWKKGERLFEGNRMNNRRRVRRYELGESEIYRRGDM